MTNPREQAAAVPERVYRVSPARRAEARQARRGIVIVALVLLAISALPWLVFTPQGISRPSLGYAAIVLAVLAVLLLVRLWRIVRKAEQFVASDGTMLAFADAGMTIAGDTTIPWDAVSGAWALDSAPALRERAQHTVFGAPGRAMLRAGVNSANLTIGVSDTSRISDPRARVRTFRAVSSELIPGRIEVPFGTQFGTAELHEVIAVLKLILPVEVPVRLTDGALDYAEAWAGTADDVATIRDREARATP